MATSSTLLGEGNFGKVFKQVIDGKTCAVKKVDNYNRTSMKEVKMLMDLQNRFIIKYYSHYFEGSTICIVMEFADKGTFASMIEVDQSPELFKEYSIWRTLFHIATALNYLHTLKPQHILHRDLKPDNILGVTEVHFGGGRTLHRVAWKLADFGIATLLTEEAQGAYYGSVMGCQTYMPPEAWSDYRKYSAKADVWSLGCIVAYTCNRGKHLFNSREEVMKWRGRQPSTAKYSYSEDLLNVIGRMLQPNPHHRPSAAELVAECTKTRRESEMH